jgi:dTDP-4-dehydrorhamnose reductase
MFLIVGGDCELGAATHRRLGEQGCRVLATTRRRATVSAARPLLDLACVADWAPPEGVKSAAIFAGYTRLAACEGDRVESARVNVSATLSIAERLLARGAHVLFLSSNQVFDGAIADVPADAPFSAISDYGRQKAAAETALLAHFAQDAPVAILRLSKVVSESLDLFRRWGRALKAGQEIRAFHDMVIAPVPNSLAAGAAAILMRERATGVYQLSGAADASYFTFGQHMARRIGADRRLVVPVPAASASVPRGATPRHTTLDSARIATRYAITAPDLETVIGMITDAL